MIPFAVYACTFIRTYVLTIFVSKRMFKRPNVGSRRRKLLSFASVVLCMRRILNGLTSAYNQNAISEFSYLASMKVLKSSCIPCLLRMEPKRYPLENNSGMRFGPARER